MPAPWRSAKRGPAWNASDSGADLSTPANPILDEPRLSRVTLRLAWPVVLSRFLHTLFHLANVAWVGRIGSEAIAAVTTSIFVVWTVHSLAQLAAIGTTSLVARHVGAGDRSGGAATSAQGFFFALLIGIVITLAGALGSGPLFALITHDLAVARAGADYLRIVTAAAIPTMILFVGEAVFRANGDTRTPMRILLGLLVLNIVLDPVLILGLGPFPRMEVRGAAVATALVQVLGASIYLVLFARGRAAWSLREMARGFRPDWVRIRRLASVGAPMSGIGILFTLIYLWLASIAAGYGTPILAALGIVNRLEGFSFLTSEGFSVAATTMVGQNIGAGRIDRADRAARNARVWSTLLTGLYMVVFLAVPEFLIGLFTVDPVVIERGALFLRIVALAQPFQGLEVALEGALAGAGDTRPALLIAIPLMLVRIPLILWLAGPMGMGAISIWWVITATSILRGLALEAWFRAGHWKRRHSTQLPPGPIAPMVG